MAGCRYWVARMGREYRIALVDVGADISFIRCDTSPVAELVSLFTRAIEQAGAGGFTFTIVTACISDVIAVNVRGADYSVAKVAGDAICTYRSVALDGTVAVLRVASVGVTFHQHTGINAILLAIFVVARRIARAGIPTRGVGAIAIGPADVLRV
jgi:hypothetical protein